MDKWFFIVIKPAVKHLQSIHQSFREISKIGFPVAELMIIDSCFQRFLIHSIFHDFFQRIFYDLNKRFLLFQIGILCNDRENRLINPIVVRSHNIFSDARIHKCLLQRRTWCRQKCIVKNLKCEIQLLIQTCPDHLVVG